MPPISQKAVDDFVITLNSGKPSGNPWIEILETWAVMQMSLPGNNAVTFNPNRGFPLKLFKNTDTQEVRMYDARKFANPN